MTAEERRSQIAKAATRLFAKHGFSGVTTRQIADAAGVNEALLYRHFPNKEVLYTEIIKLKIEAQGTLLDPAMLEGEDDGAIMRYVVGTFIEQISAEKNFLRLMFFSALEDHRLATMFFEKRIGSVMPMLAGYFERRMDSGAFRRMDPRIAIRALMGMIMHYVISTQIFELPKWLDVTREDVIDGFGKVFLEGVRAK